MTLSKIFNNVSISELINDVKIDDYVKKLISDELESKYLLSYNDGETDNYYTFYCEDLNIIKKLKHETEFVESINYKNINWDNINEEYPEYELTKKVADYAQWKLAMAAVKDEMFRDFFVRFVIIQKLQCLLHICNPKMKF